MKRNFLSLVVILLVSTGVLYAKGGFNRILLTAPDGTSIEITDPVTLDALSMTVLEDFPHPIDQPDVSGDGYELQRQYKVGDSYSTFDRVRYYPVGDAAYVYYVGIENGSSEYDKKWYKARPAAIEVMNELIAGEAHPTTSVTSPTLAEWQQWFAQLGREIINAIHN